MKLNWDVLLVLFVAPRITIVIAARNDGQWSKS